MGPPPLPRLSRSVTGWPAEEPAPRGLGSRTVGLRGWGCSGQGRMSPPRDRSPWSCSPRLPGCPLSARAWGALPGPRDDLARREGGLWSHCRPELQGDCGPSAIVGTQERASTTGYVVGHQGSLGPDPRPRRRKRLSERAASIPFSRLKVSHTLSSYGQSAAARPWVL